MITRQNFKYYVQTIEYDDLQSELNKDNDYILLQTHIFNVGGYATIRSLDYDQATESEANANGWLFCDKDTFMQLCDELQTGEI